MIQDITYTEEKGNISQNDITVYALSTCGFCKRGLQFLRDNSISFRYVYVDKLDINMKEQIKQALSERFDTRIGYPFLVIDDSDYLRGFVKEEWENKLLE